MRLSITAGSSFVGEYVLAEAVRGGHRCVALACSDVAAHIVVGRSVEPTRSDLGEPDGLGKVFAEARCEPQVNLASLGSGPAQTIMAKVGGAGIGRRVFISTTPCDDKLVRPNETEPVGSQAADPAVQDRVDHPAAHHDL